MYLWKVDSLVEDFRSEKVTQEEEFKYMLVFTIAVAFASDPALYAGSSYNQYDAMVSVIVLGISIFGVYYCYKINSGGDNKDFIVRMMCIGLPVMVRVLVIMFPAYLAGAILEAVFLYPEPVDETLESTPVHVALVAVVTATYYGYLSVKIRAVSKEVS